VRQQAVTYLHLCVYMFSVLLTVMSRDQEAACMGYSQILTLFLTSLKAK
jgi:hypothetical protein